MPDLRPGDPSRIGAYEVLSRLGAGGMGEVFLGRSPGGKLVALKVIRPELSAEPGFRERFRREALAMKAVSGAYTAPVIDADADGDPAWIATAYIEAPSLSEAVRRDGPLPAERVSALAAGLAEALWAVHREGLTHRDLKPGNVLLAADGPRVIDFGLAVSAENSALTKSGVIIGTPAYMAPEQISGKGAGPASDVFALGAVLAFAATGRAPFGDGPPVELVYRIVHHEPELDGLPEALTEPIRACLAKDPAERPSPEKFLSMLKGDATVPLGAPTPFTLQTLIGADPDASTVGLPPAPGTAVMPPPAPVTTAAAVAVAAPIARGGGRRKTLIGAAAAVVVAAVAVVATLAASNGGGGGGSTAGVSGSRGTVTPLSPSSLFSLSDTSMVLQIDTGWLADQGATTDGNTKSQTWATKDGYPYPASVRIDVTAAASVDAAKAFYGNGRAATQTYAMPGADAAAVSPVGPDTSGSTRQATVIFRVANVVVQVHVFETRPSADQCQKDAETVASTAAGRIPPR